MKRTALLLALGGLLSCGTADDAGSARPGSTAGDSAAESRGAARRIPPPAGSAAGPGGSRAGADDGRARVVFLGTSLTAGLGLLRDAERFTDLLQSAADSAGVAVAIVNAGLSGDTSAGGLRRLEWVLQEPADVLVVELGANDGLRGLSVEALRDNLENVILRARALSPDVRIVLVGMEAPPNLGTRYTTQFRQVYADLAREHEVALIPFLLEGVGGVTQLNQEDGIHPNVAGHRMIARTLWPYLEPVFREAAARGRAR